MTTEEAISEKRDYSDNAPLLEWLRQPRWMEGSKQKRLFEAADEIERLRKENDKLRACID